MRIRVYLPYVDIKDVCRRRSDFYSDVEVSPNDVQFINVDELIRLIKANPEYIQHIKEFLRKLDEATYDSLSYKAKFG
jgi:hypothetical protein